MTDYFLYSDRIPFTYTFFQEYISFGKDRFQTGIGTLNDNDMSSDIGIIQHNDFGHNDIILGGLILPFVDSLRINKLKIFNRPIDLIPSINREAFSLRNIFMSVVDDYFSNYEILYRYYSLLYGGIALETVFILREGSIILIQAHRDRYNSDFKIVYLDDGNNISSFLNLFELLITMEMPSREEEEEEEEERERYIPLPHLDTSTSYYSVPSTSSTYRLY